MKTFTTPNGKEVQIIKNSRGDTVIQFATGGELPAYLTGIFTSEREAEKAVLYFLSQKEEQKAKLTNAKASK